MSFAKQTFAKQTFAKQITLVKQWARLIVCINTPQKTSDDSAMNLKKSIYVLGWGSTLILAYLWKIDVIKGKYFQGYVSMGLIYTILNKMM